MKITIQSYLKKTKSCNKNDAFALYKALKTTVFNIKVWFCEFKLIYY